jgi:hypothetical protein
MAPALAALALTSAGCFPFVQDEEAAQPDAGGPVTVSTTTCDNPAGGAVFVEGYLARILDGGIRARGLDLVNLTGCLDRDEVIADAQDGGLPTMPRQMLVAYRVPKGAEAPPTITATGDVVTSDDGVLVPLRSSARRLPAVRRALGRTAPLTRGGPSGAAVLDDQQIVFRRAPEMDGQLQEFHAGLDAQSPDEPRRADEDFALAGPDQKLVGYVSTVIPGVVLDELKLDAPFGLPGASGDTPYAGRFDHLSMAGMRLVLTDEQIAEIAEQTEDEEAVAMLRETLGVARPVDCLTPDDIDLDDLETEEEAIFTLMGGGWCPLPKVAFAPRAERAAGDEPVDPYAGEAIDVRDFRIAGGEGFAEQGQTATVPFTLKTAGAAGGRLSYRATSALPGAALSAPGAGEMPATGGHRRTVEVQIPADAAPGTHEVVLEVTSGAVTRKAKGAVVVLPKPAPAVQPQQQRQTPPVEQRETVLMAGDGTIALTVWCPFKGVTCGSQQFDALGPKAGIAASAQTAQAQKPRLLRIGRSKHRVAEGRSARVKIKLFPRAVRAIRGGRQVKGLVVVRAGGKGVPAVRRLVIKRRR